MQHWFRWTALAAILGCLCAILPAQAAECVRINSGGDSFSGEVVARDRTSITIRDASTGTPAPYPLAGLDGPPISIPCDGGGTVSARPGMTIKMSGSATIGEKLAPALVAPFGHQLGLNAGDTIVHPHPLQQIVTVRGDGASLEAEIDFAGTKTAWPAMKADPSVIGMASARVSAEQSSDFAAHGLGELRAPGNEHVIGLDGIRVIVNQANPLQSVTMEDLRRIYGGQVRHWSEIDHSLPPGGPADDIVLYELDEKSGTHKTFDELVMAGTSHASWSKKDERPDVIAAAVKQNPAAIAYVGYAYGQEDRSLPIAEPACGLVLPPSPFLIKAEEYPLARRLFLYTTSQAGRLPLQFAAFAEGAEAQETAGRLGYVSLLPEAANEAYTTRRAGMPPPASSGRAAAAMRASFAKAIGGARRLSITFRFQLGSDALDSRGQADVTRLAAAIKNDYAGHNVILIGHSSADGDFASNVRLSRSRASDVAGKLAALGVRVSKVTGVGPVSQVSCLSSDPASDQTDINRRVEVWVH